MLFQQPRPAALDRDRRIDHGQGGQQALATVGADHLERLSSQGAAVQIGEEEFPLGGAFAGCQAIVDDLLPAIGPEAEGHQDRPLERTGAGLAGQHHAVEHERLVAVLQGPAVEGRDRSIQGLGDPAHGGGADRSAEQGQQDLADLAGTEPEHEASQDGAADLGRAPGIAPEHRTRAEPLGARHRELDITQLAHQMTSVAAVAAVAHGTSVKTIEPVIDRFGHPTLHDLGQGLATQRAVPLAPFKTLGLHNLHHLEGHR